MNRTAYAKHVAKAWRAAGRALVRSREAIESARRSYPRGIAAFDDDIAGFDSIAATATDLARKGTNLKQWTAEAEEYARNDYVDEDDLQVAFGAQAAARALAQTILGITGPVQDGYDDVVNFEETFWEAFDACDSVRDCQRYADTWNSAPKTALKLIKILEAARASAIKHGNDADKLEVDVLDLVNVE